MSAVPSDPLDRTAEKRRLAEAVGRAEDDLLTANPWYEGGPYLSERAWGTVREDYSETGDAWSYFPHDHARSRAYRWNEDGMAGISDIGHELCLALALWNGVDPILKGAHVRIDWSRRATTARTSRSTGGISTRCRATLGCAGAITTRRPPSHINGSSRRTHAVLATSPSSSCWIPGLSTKTGIGWWRSRTRRPHQPSCSPRSGGEQGSDEAKLSVLPTLWFRNSWRFSRARLRN